MDSVDSGYFHEIELVEGKFPQNDHEILLSSEYIGNSSFRLNSKITLTQGLFLIDGVEVKERCSECVEEEIFVPKEDITYTIVGYYGNNPYISLGQEVAITKIQKVSDQAEYDIYLQFDKMKDADKITSELAKKIGGNEVRYNSSLLGLSGISKYDNIIESLIKSMAILLALVSIGCIVVIYNSFAISVLERKKQFGLFSSIGATKKQIKHTVIFEAIVVGLKAQ